MKKKKNRILSVSGAALCLFFPVLLAACSQEDALPRPLEVSAEVGNPATRATDAHADDYDKREFVAGDVIRITDGTKTADYQRVVTGTTGTWQPASGQTALTTTGSETFTASYPTAFTQILIDQRTATNFWKSNRLTATGVLDGNKATFSFAPEAAKVTLVVKYGNSDSDKKLPGTASLEGTGIATGASESQTINAYGASAAGTSALQHTYVAIVKPGSRTFTIKVKAGDTGETEKSYTEKAAHTLKAGYNYQYNFTSTNELILNGITVERFVETTEQDAGNAT
ncbi:putative exported transmembrane protein [Bacteroides fragilis str. S23L24]|uniref:fimbrillin family protein n=1 Tax=Bacteroides fragilis TaxID=817 RepID=UPI00044AC387|nr:fimbrillin family protein [Bacteroides fragilis]EYA63904.1 putative exported transmembrane protein [Bacteroides fragilis str. S23L24]MCS2588714.1 fimbrillin family protein [Bacteroides fragilis]